MPDLRLRLAVEVKPVERLQCRRLSRYLDSRGPSRRLDWRVPAIRAERLNCLGSTGSALSVDVRSEAPNKKGPRSGTKCVGLSQNCL
jgi:hypothetical protein